MKELWLWEQPMREVFLQFVIPARKIRSTGRNRAGNRTCDRRDHGSYHDRGNQPRIAQNILQGMRTLTGNIVLEMGYATGLHREALIATGVVYLCSSDHQLQCSNAERRTEHE